MFSPLTRERTEHETDREGCGGSPAPAGARLALAGGLAGLARYRWLALANLYLLSPVLLYNVAPRSGGRLEAVAVWLLLTSVLWLATFQLLARRPLTFFALATPFALVVLADLVSIATLDTRLTASYLTVIAYNLHEAPEFLQAFGPRVALALALFLAGYGLCLVKLRGLELPVRRRWAAAPLAALVLLYAGVSVRQAVRLDARPARALLDVVSHDTSSPFGVLPQAFVTWQLHRDTTAALAEREGFRFGAVRSPDAPAGPELYVLVIGETSRPDRWGLNGYARDTTPRLGALAELVSFTDVVSQSPSTSDSIPLMITRARADQWLQAASQRSIVSAFGEAGFRTWWLTTQEVSHWAGPIHHYAAEADTVRYYERRHDGALVEPFAALLDELRAPGDRGFVVVHTQGSHFAFENRYPREFARWPVRGDRRQRLSNAYDNTILYTDHVLAELIARLQARPDLTSALLFVADHGENLLDDERALFGHAVGTVYDLRIAAFAWCSPAYVARYPLALERARARRHAPLSTHNVFDSLADLGRLRVPGARPELSVFGPKLARTPRLFRARGKVRSFEELLGGAGHTESAATVAGEGGP